MNATLRNLTVPLGFAGALLSAPGIAHSDCQIDQEQALGSAFIFVVGDFGGSIHHVAQTFTVGADGVLGEIHLRGSVSVTPPGTGPLTVQILPTVGGVPDHSGVPLLTREVRFEELPYGVFPPPEVVIDVSSLAAPVQAGETWALVLSVPSGAFGWVFRNNDVYAAGTAWTREDSETSWSSQTVDTFFRTVVCAASVSVDPGFRPSSWGRTKAAYRDEAPGE